jgi:hypothetical protein
MNIALFILSAADASIPWPARGSAEKTLCDRTGWERRTIATQRRGEPIQIEAMCRGELAVNQMLDGDEGFAICLSATGFRLSCNGCVFARCADAMASAEAMMEACSDWGVAQRNGYTDAQCEAFRAIVKAAERRGEIMLDRVYPI